ncbi:MAG TPA: O-succinylhomoserine sulfhydrylase [Caulobacteraceae bacterium]
MAEDPKTWKAETKLVRGGLDRSPHGETSEALYLTQGYVYASADEAEARFKGESPGFVYSRYANPTNRMFEERLALLDGAEACRSTASGMAAVHLALMGLLRAGDHLVSGRALFGSCRWIVSQWLPRFGVETTIVDGRDVEAWRAAMRPNTKAVFLESPANPLMELVDLEAVADIAHAAGAKVVVDNVFASPILQKPLQLGADVVVYSATKHIDGQGRVLGGAVLGAAQLLDESYRDVIRHTGPTLSAFNAWVMLKGLETLDLRVRRQAETAVGLCALFDSHPKVKRFYYPHHPSFPQYELAKRQMSGGGTVVAIDLGTKAAAFNVLNALEIVDISNNLADAKSLITHPSTTTHRALTEEERQELGLTEGWVRLSVGLEAPEDLERDLSRTLDKA